VYKVIKAVIFDLGGVLLKGSIRKFIEKGEQILGVKAKSNSELDFDRKLNLGISSERAAFERVFGKKMFDHEFIPLMKAWLSNWALDGELLEYAKALGKRYKVAIMSNSAQSFVEKHEEEWGGIFSPIVYSHKVRMMKPGKEIFEYTLQKLGLKPEECVLVDDCRENGETCKQLGMHFVLYRNLNKLKKDLELYGVRASV